MLWTSSDTLPVDRIDFRGSVSDNWSLLVVLVVEIGGEVVSRIDFFFFTIVEETREPAG